MMVESSKLAEFYATGILSIILLHNPSIKTMQN